jgi:hypothetical protein
MAGHVLLIILYINKNERRGCGVFSQAGVVSNYTFNGQVKLKSELAKNISNNKQNGESIKQKRKQRRQVDF